MPLNIITHLGIDRYLESKPGSERIALVTNDAAITTSLISSRVALLKAGFNPRKIIFTRTWHFSTR
jgi:hypothetical protein